MRLRLFGFVFAFIATASPAACPTQPRTAAGVLATEKAWVAALEQRDGAALDCILDTGFADTTWRGVLVTKAQIMARLPSRPPSTLDLTDLQPTLLGDTAILRGVNTQRSGTTVIGSVRFVDVFAYRSGRWQAVSAQESLIQAR
jgi:hypothetical protein